MEDSQQRGAAQGALQREVSNVVLLLAKGPNAPAYFPFISSLLSFSVEKQNRHAMVVLFLFVFAVAGCCTIFTLRF
jgi:hypothetical protein